MTHPLSCCNKKEGATVFGFLVACNCSSVCVTTVALSIPLNQKHQEVASAFHDLQQVGAMAAATYQPVSLGTQVKPWLEVKDFIDTSV